MKQKRGERQKHNKAKKRGIVSAAIPRGHCVRQKSLTNDLPNSICRRGDILAYALLLKQPRENRPIVERQQSNQSDSGTSRCFQSGRQGRREIHSPRNFTADDGGDSESCDHWLDIRRTCCS